MTYTKNQAENSSKPLRSKKRFRWLAGLSLGLLIPLALEFSRWHTLPTEAYPISVSGLAVVFEPGTDFRYSTHSYTLLGAVLEKAAGVGYDELFDREIVTPLGLESTGLDSPIPGPRTAHSYEIAYGRYRKGLTVNSSRCWPGGGVRSSANDLAQLISALPLGDLISRSSLESLLTPQNLPDGSPNPQNYALGWRLVQTEDFLGGQGSYRLAHHGGVASGGSSFVVFFPDQSLAVVVLTNTRTGSRPLSKLALEIAEPFMAAHLGLDF